MDKSGITEETAGQISKLRVSADSYDHPGCSWHTWGDPRPQGGPPQPLEKKCREGHLVVKNRIMLHELNFMGSTPPPMGLTLPVWNTGVRLVDNKTGLIFSFWPPGGKFI